MGCVVSAEDGGSKQEPSFHPVSSSYVEKRKGYPETLTAAERAAMAEVRSELAAAGIVGARWDDDDEMCRWLRARKFDVAATKLMITNHVKWEKDYDVDLVYKTFAHRDPEAVKAAYPRTYHRTDRIGRPINIDRVGRLNIKRINELTNNDEMEKEKIQDMEHTLRVRYPACSKAAGRTINQSLVIMDLSGMTMSIWNAQTRGTLKRLIGVLSDHYPETMGQLFIVNAPSFFAAVWAVVKLFLDPGTVQKISILSHNFKHELFKHVEPANLPPFLGGTDNTFDLMREQGPWVPHSENEPVIRQQSMYPADRGTRRWLMCCGGT